MKVAQTSAPELHRTVSGRLLRRAPAQSPSEAANATAASVP
jgi:hypothetical protein